MVDFKELRKIINSSNAKKCGQKTVETLDSITKRAEQNVGIIMDCFGSSKPVTAQQVRDEMLKPASIRDSIINGRWNTANAVDPARASLALPNIYISPWEANSLYSQKGIFETVINKKSKSILLNGINLENPKLTQKQLDTVKERMEVHNFKNVLLIYNIIYLNYLKI